ncbi:hypothetical protein MKW92_006024 [Papaver armeniacum]|nr:hypothetical protein MKW92_006024 [Papaver armeniacum]
MNMSKEPGLVRCLTRCTIKPYPNISKQTQPAHQQERQQQKPHHIQKHQSYHLTPWVLSLISAHSIQVGLLYAKPPSSLSVSSVDNVGDQNHSLPGAFVDQLKNSLSRTLAHFLPLSGRFVTNKHDDPPSSSISIECNDEDNSFQGVEFIVAAAPITLNDILSPRLITTNVFPTTTPLLSVQVTELVDGYFIGCSINHAVVGGTSFWHFFNAWEHQDEVDNVEHDSHSIINLPFSHSDEFISRFPPPPLCGTNKISKFQALTALIWRSLTRARGLHPEQETSCAICINDRDRLNPPLSKNYFGCYITIEMVKTKAGELLLQNLGSTALGHEVIADHTDENIRRGSPRFNPYGCDFGWGKPLAVLSGWPYKFSGNVCTNPGKAGGGSVDLEICLSPEAMSALEADDEFMGATSTHHEMIM